MGRKTEHHSLVTDELWEKVLKDNKELINDFLDYKRSSDKSEGTIFQYYQALKVFFVWNMNNNNNKFFIDIKKREFIRFFNYVGGELHSSPNRIRFFKATLSSISNYIEVILDDEYPTYRNIVKVLETVSKEPVREKTILTEDKINDCLNKLVQEKRYQVACYFALAVASGARKSELLRFKVDYFKDENIVFGCMYKTPEKIVTKGKGSRGKMLYKYTFINMFKPYFDLWMKEREELGIDNEYLFVTKHSAGVYGQAEVYNANRWADLITKSLGESFYFHSCRHYWTSELKRKGLPDSVIKELQGWQSIEMVSIYSDIELEETLGDYFDENGIKERKEVRISDLK